MKISAFTFSAMALSVASFFSTSAIAQAPAFITKNGGKIIKTEPGPAGLTAYTVETKNGKQAVLFGTPDGSAALAGVVFDAKTGENLSDPFVPQKAVEALAQQNTPSMPAVSPPSTMQEVEESLNSGVGEQNASAATSGEKLRERLLSDTVIGISEGSGTPTSFVFFDPRCAYCHNLVRNTRDAIKNGASIKWIPVNTLGDAGVPMSIELIKRGKEGLPMMASNTLTGVEPNAVERQQVQQNTALLFMLTQAANVKVATPTIMFMGSNGKLTIAQDDGSNKKLIDVAFK